MKDFHDVSLTIEELRAQCDTIASELIGNGDNPGADIGPLKIAIDGVSFHVCATCDDGEGLMFTRKQFGAPDRENATEFRDALIAAFRRRIGCELSVTDDRDEKRLLAEIKKLGFWDRRRVAKLSRLLRRAERRARP